MHNNVALGHTRLSIVDLVRGDQPIIDPERRTAIVCNGEIYNYIALRDQLERQHSVRFTTSSDCEAILHAYRVWPDSFVERLDGMFAFALLDAAKDRLVIGRDRIGIKPLFWAETQRMIAFGSEIKSILQVPELDHSPDSEAIGDLLTFGYPMGNRTAFRRVECFPPGHLMTLELGSVDRRTRRYWDGASCLEDRATDSLTVSESIRELEATLGSAVTSHTIGDTPFGLYLSGGLDSSIIGALLSRIAGPLFSKAFSLSFPGTQFDESHHAQVVGEALGIPVDVVPDTRWEFAHLRHAIRHLEVPQIVTLDLSMIALSATARESKCKYVFAGDGADELFGGYDHFSLLHSRRFTNRFANEPERVRGFQFAAQYLGYPEDYIRRYFDQAHSWHDTMKDCLPWYPIWRANAEISRGILANPTDSFRDGGELHRTWIESGAASPRNEAADRATLFELRSRLPNWILLKSDRNAMANGIEVRVPFLDNHVIKCAFRSPSVARSVPMHGKWLLKEAFGRLLPTSLVHRPKKAFNTPHNWVFRDCSADLDDLLSERAIRQTGLFRSPEVATLRRSVADAYQGVTQPSSMMQVLSGQTLLGVVTTQLLYNLDFVVKDPGPIPASSLGERTDVTAMGAQIQG